MDQTIETSDFGIGMQHINGSYCRQDDMDVPSKLAARDQQYDDSLNAMVRYTKKNTSKYFNMTKQGEMSFIKASNVLLEPFSEIKRGQDAKAEKKLRMPTNPLGVTLTNKQVQTLTTFCKRRNIPFNENEQRFYMKAKQDHS